MAPPSAATTAPGPGSRTVPLAFAAAIFLIHMAFSGGFGFHHDELYFVACGERFAFGYVDQPPLVPWIAALCRWLLGESLRGLRLFPALAGAGAVYVTGLLAARLGGGRLAQGLACLAMLIAPAYLRSQNMLSIPAFEPLLWTLCSYLVVRALQEVRPRLWLGAGLVAGAGLMTKHTMAFYLAGLAVGLLATAQRRQLARPWPWAGAGLALLLFLPNLIWQAAHGWPTLEWLGLLNARVMRRIPAGEFLAGQVIYLHPLTLPLWLAGLWFLLGSARGRPFRFLGWIYLVVLGTLLATGGKIYYLAPAYPPLLAGGAVLLETALARPGRAWARAAIPAILAAGGLLMAPVSLPILPITTTDRFIQAASFGALKNSYEVTADLHDQFGWQELVALTADAWETLAPEERERAIILAADRGAASAIDFFGPALGLPPARSGVLSYHLWGYGDEPVDVLVTVGFGRETLDKISGNVTEVGVFTHPHVNPWRNNELVAVCRPPTMAMERLWPQLKRW